jgi:hypothetical protein
MYWRTPTPWKGELARDDNGEGITTLVATMAFT